jgi:alkylation response protein AidB-like acyl-CoA dehydrogenase
MPVGDATASERAELLELAGGLARRELTKRAGALDAGDSAVIAACWRQLAELGLDRALLLEEHGGAELEVADFLAVVEELAVGDGGIALCVVLSNAALGAVAPETLATIPAGARWVLVPAPPGDLASSGTLLTGRVTGALGAHGADGLVLIGDREAAIPADAPGLKCERDNTQMGLRAAPMAEIALDSVAAQPVLTTGGESLALLRAGMAAISRGIARRAYEMARDYAYERHQGGVAIIEHDAVKDMLAAMAVRLTLPLPPAIGHRQALAAKIGLTDAAVATTIDAVQVFGGAGYMRETGIEKLMRDAMYCRLFPESNWVARDALMQDERRTTDGQALRPPSTVSSAPVT